VARASPPERSGGVGPLRPPAPVRGTGAGGERV